MLLALHGHSTAHRRVPAVETPFCTADTHKDSCTLQKEILQQEQGAAVVPHIPPSYPPSFLLTSSYPRDTISCTGFLVLTYHLPLRGFMDTKAQRSNYLHKSQEYTSSLSVPVISHSFFPNLLHIKTVRVDGVDENRISFP